MSRTLARPVKRGPSQPEGPGFAIPSVFVGFLHVPDLAVRHGAEKNMSDAQKKAAEDKDSLALGMGAGSAGPRR